MKRYTVSMARERFASVLDEAETSGGVIVERGDVQYVITARKAPRRKGTRKSVIDIVDPAVRDGEWHWEWTGDGVAFAEGRPRR